MYIKPKNKFRKRNDTLRSEAVDMSFNNVLLDLTH